MIPAKDISKYQGNWQDTGEQIVLIKISGGDDGLYFDSDATENYNGAKVDNRHVGGYHFVGWQMGAVQEASWFLKGMAPLTENDVYALDCENGKVDVSASSPAYILEMVNYIHDQIGVWPLVYMNLSTLNAYDWDTVLANCGLWLADWNNNPNGSISTNHTYVMQQYSDGPVYDHDEWFGSVEAFDAYGWHANTPPSTTTTTTQSPLPPVPDPTTTTTTTTTVEPEPSSTTTTTTVQPDGPSSTTNIFVEVWNFIINLFRRK